MVWFGLASLAPHHFLQLSSASTAHRIAQFVGSCIAGLLVLLRVTLADSMCVLGALVCFHSVYRQQYTDGLTRVVRYVHDVDC